MSLPVGIFVLFEDRLQIPETKECCYWRRAAERFVSLPVGIFGFVLKTERRYLKQKSVAIGEERFVSLPVDSPPPPFFFFLSLF